MASVSHYETRSHPVMLNRPQGSRLFLPKKMRARVIDQLDGLRMARGGAILDDVLPDRGAQAAAWPALITPPLGCW